MEAEVLKQVGRQLCGRAGSESDSKLHKSKHRRTDADPARQTDLQIRWPQTDEGNDFCVCLAGVIPLDSCSGIHSNTTLAFSATLQRAVGTER